ISEARCTARHCLPLVEWWRVAATVGSVTGGPVLRAGRFDEFLADGGQASHSSAAARAIFPIQKPLCSAPRQLDELRSVQKTLCKQANNERVDRLNYDTNLKCDYLISSHSSVCTAIGIINS